MNHNTGYYFESTEEDPCDYNLNSYFQEFDKKQCSSLKNMQCTTDPISLDDIKSSPTTLRLLIQTNKSKNGPTFNLVCFDTGRLDCLHVG